MRQTKVKVSDLLETLKKNRRDHRNYFEVAQENYRKAVVEHLETMLKDAQQKKRIRRAITLPEPEDHTDDYDRVIRMLEMSTEKKVDIDEHQFAQFVMDDWDWKRGFVASSSAYNAQMLQDPRYGKFS